MQTLTTSNEMFECSAILKSKGLRIGFVPTMGALHAGHLSLIQASKQENDITICSVFVNPTQFNDTSDFEKYPRQLDEDLRLLKQNGCDIAFTPSVKEVYPKADLVTYDLGKISEILEGTKRPGHFNGMASVVKRFFEITQPHRAYFGLKDYQQCLVVKALVTNYNIPVDIQCCPILREITGLAMSSRNQRLSKEGETTAVNISLCLKKMKAMEPTDNIEQLLTEGNDYLAGIKNLELEYLEIRDAETLEEPKTGLTSEIVILIAAWVEGVRLIDNMTMKFGEEPN